MNGIHRRPPKPMSWNCPKGNCRFCGVSIVENGRINRRKHWCRKACIGLWRLINRPREMRRHVFIRDKGVCQECGFFRPSIRDFEADHILPLFDAFGDLRYWEPTNVHLKCKDCHKEKTKEDMVLYRQLKGLI